MDFKFCQPVCIYFFCIDPFNHYWNHFSLEERVVDEHRTQNTDNRIPNTDYRLPITDEPPSNLNTPSSPTIPVFYRCGSMDHCRSHAAFQGNVAFQGHRTLFLDQANDQYHRGCFILPAHVRRNIQKAYQPDHQSSIGKTLSVLFFQYKELYPDDCDDNRRNHTA